MATDPNPPVSEDDGPEPDPVEAELIAYLDGELDPAAARVVEAKLTSDPKLRARAGALKRSYALLDFLPKPEPSPTFTTRTLDKLPPVAAGAPRAAATLPAATPVPIPGRASASIPAGLSAGDARSSHPSVAVLTSPRGGRPWAWAAGVLAAAGLALGAGYFGTAAVRSYLLPHPSPRDAEAIPLEDWKVIENLPLYAAADDLDFLERLTAPDFFGEEPALPDGVTPPQPVEPEKPTEQQLKSLAKAFRELPPDQQARVRRFDRLLNEQEPARRDRLARVLASYAAWLYRLPDPDRKAVLAAPTAEKRVEVIRDVQNSQWVENLPAEQRKKLKSLPTAERAALLGRWRAQEELHRNDWLAVRAHWETVRTGKPLWPFQDDRMKKAVLEFTAAAYHPEDARRCRLTPADRDRLVEAIKGAQEAGDRTRLFPLGKAVYDFSRKSAYEMLPEPASGKPVVEVADLVGWDAAHKHFLRPNPKSKVAHSVGKWPDFALEVHAEMNRTKFGGILQSHHLGPCRPAEFKDEVRRFIPELQKKLTADQAKALKAAEGKWPDYPRELIKLARAHDLSVPGAMPPGPPSMWEKTYNLGVRLPAQKPGG